MKPRVNPKKSPRRRNAFSLVELMVASTIALVLTGTSMFLLIEAARESRRGMADASVEAGVGNLQHRLMGCLRGMSADEGAIFSEPMYDSESNLLGFRRIIVARGPAPDFPREELRFDAGTGAVIHDPNRSVAGDENVLGLVDARMALRRVSFTPSIKADSTPDNSLVHISIAADDNGASGRPLPNAASVRRVFSVRMRNH